MQPENLRLVEVNPNWSGQKVNGVFHCWCKEPFSAGDNDEYITKTYALVELHDGKVDLVDPKGVKFVDPLILELKKKAS